MNVARYASDVSKIEDVEDSNIGTIEAQEITGRNANDVAGNAVKDNDNPTTNQEDIKPPKESYECSLLEQESYQSTQDASETEKPIGTGRTRTIWECGLETGIRRDEWTLVQKQAKQAKEQGLRVSHNLNNNLNTKLNVKHNKASRIHKDHRQGTNSTKATVRFGIPRHVGARIAANYSTG